MLKKYTLIACFSIAASFLIQYIFDEGKTRLAEENNYSFVSKKYKRSISTKLASNDDVVAAILIMPKSYLPVIKRYSQSKMAKHIKILQAKLEWKDGDMTAIHQPDNEYQRNLIIKSDAIVPNNIKNAKIEHQSTKKRPMIVAGILYLMANAHKSKLY